MWLYLLLGKGSIHRLFLTVIHGTVFPLYMLILGNCHLLISFFQLPLTPPQHSCATLLSLKAVPSSGLQPNFFLLDGVAEEPCGQYPITLPQLQPFLSLLTLMVLVKVFCYYCVCQNVQFPYIFIIHNPVFNVVCHTQKPGRLLPVSNTTCIWVPDGLLCSKYFHKWWSLFQSGNHFS